MHDKTDFQNYKKQSTNISVDLMNKPEILGILNQLIQLLQPRLQFQQNNMRRNNNNNMGRGGPRMNQMRSAPGPMGPGMGQPGMGQPGMGQPGMNPMMHGGPQPGMGMQPQPMGMPPQPMGMPSQPGMMQRQPQPQGIPPYIQMYMTKAMPLIPAVHPANPNYKGQVGEAIFEFVEKIAGEEKAPKITGMLIDLPMEEIVGYLKDFGKLQEKISEADNLLRQNMQ